MKDIEIHNVSKSYGKVKALSGISLEVDKGEIFGLIGPDGAGKTTLFRILTTLLLADEGTASVTGLDVKKDYAMIRRRIGYMPGRFSLYQDLSVKENLEFFATVFGTTVKENYDVIRDIYSQIEPFKERRAGALSGGMKQKLALSCALVHKPSVLFLDEPTTGVDAVSRRDFWNMLARIKASGVTVFVSTPYMDEAVRQGGPHHARENHRFRYACTDSVQISLYPARSEGYTDVSTSEAPARNGRGERMLFVRRGAPCVHRQFEDRCGRNSRGHFRGRLYGMRSAADQPWNRGLLHGSGRKGP